MLDLSVVFQIGRKRSYADEAINTIVQEMENNRDELVVIFAGYPDPMDEFLKTNPGLKSRIAFHVDFADYSPCELFEILELLTNKDGSELNAEVKVKLMPYLETVSGDIDFGNGRFVRNMLEKARMKQAGRLLQKGYDNVTKADCATLISDDFDIFPVKRKQTLKIGFGG